MTLRTLQVGLTIAAFWALLALRIGPARAFVVFLGVAALVTLALGAYMGFLYFWYPDSNGDNWFSSRKRRR